VACFPHFNGTGCVFRGKWTGRSFIIYCVDLRIRTSTEPVSLNTEKFAWKYPWICGYFLQCTVLHELSSWQMLRRSDLLIAYATRHVSHHPILHLLQCWLAAAAAAAAANRSVGQSVGRSVNFLWRDDGSVWEKIHTFSCLWATSLARYRWLTVPLCVWHTG